MRAVVPAVLLGETAPVDASDQAESTVDGSDTTMPHAPASDIVDVDAGAPYSQTRSSTLGHALHHKAFWIRSNTPSSHKPSASMPGLLLQEDHFCWIGICMLTDTNSKTHLFLACAENIADDDNTAADTEALGGAKTKAAVDALLSQLPKCISRDLCDELSVNFCYLNSKAARKRLVRTLCESNHRSNLQLLPFYCRVAATLSQVFPDVGVAVLKAQEEEFNYLQVQMSDLLLI